MVKYEEVKKKYDETIKSGKFICSECSREIDDETMIKIFKIVKEKSPPHVFPELMCRDCLIKYQKNVNKERFKEHYSVENLLADLEKDYKRFYMKGNNLAYREKKPGAWGKIKV